MRESRNIWNGWRTTELHREIVSACHCSCRSAVLLWFSLHIQTADFTALCPSCCHPSPQCSPCAPIHLVFLKIRRNMEICSWQGMGKVVWCQYIWAFPADQHHTSVNMKQLQLHWTAVRKRLHCSAALVDQIALPELVTSTMGNFIHLCFPNWWSRSSWHFLDCCHRQNCCA